MHTPELLVVLPVYNERASIGHVMDGWIEILDQHVSDFLILTINDGSTDDTLAILEKLQKKHGDRVEIRSRENRGHGQSCLEGYRVASERGIPFVLQIDSDGQSAPRFFPDFWKIRGQYDVIYGKRNRQDGRQRVIASLALRSLIRLFEKVNCIDANVPYRLMNTRACQSAFDTIPPTINLANIALAVLLQRDQELRHGMVPIDFPPRYGGEPSVPITKFLLKGAELFIQLRALRKISIQ